MRRCRRAPIFLTVVAAMLLSVAQVEYDIAVVETSVFDTTTKRVVWTGVTETYEPTSIARDAPGFADVIANALQRRGVLPGGA